MSGFQMSSTIVCLLIVWLIVDPRWDVSITVCLVFIRLIVDLSWVVGMYD